MDELTDLFKVIGAFVGVLVVCALVIGGIATPIVYFSNRSECTNYRAISGHETYFTLTTGCLVRNDAGKWVALGAWTGNNADVTVRSK